MFERERAGAVDVERCQAPAMDAMSQRSVLAFVFGDRSQHSSSLLQAEPLVRHDPSVHASSMTAIDTMNPHAGTTRRNRRVENRREIVACSESPQCFQA
jgi:hypothetical protein